MLEGNYIVIFDTEKYITKASIVTKENNKPKNLIEFTRQDNGSDYEILIFSIQGIENSIFIPNGDNDVVELLNILMGTNPIIFFEDDYERAKINEENKYLEFKKSNNGFIINFNDNSFRINKMGKNKLVNIENDIVTRLESIFSNLENKYDTKKR